MFYSAPVSKSGDDVVSIGASLRGSSTCSIGLSMVPLASSVGGLGSAGSSCSTVASSAVGGLSVGQGSVLFVTSSVVPVVVVCFGEWG